MYFKRLDMHGFKSFAEPVSLEFMDGMTCIVGPNGSGKSNIADAIKWVLGEQSPKNLRGGKMEEVIFAGTENRKARGIAEVTLVIDNREGILPIEFNEVAITRKMYRSGESEYLINGRNCRLKDIRELIIDTGMGVDGYSMIGQGKISEIVNNKAEGRRELFEAAAGISKYRIRKFDAEKKLVNSKGNLDRVNDIIFEIEGRIDGLKSDSEKAEEYIKLSSKYKEIEINLAVIQADGIVEKVKALRIELENSDVLIKNFYSEKEKNDKELETLLIENEDVEKRLQFVSEAFFERNEEINKAKNSIGLSEARLSSCEKDIERVTKEIDTNRNKFEKEAFNISENEGRLQFFETKFSEMNLNLEEKQIQYRENSSIAEERYKEIENKKSDVFQLHSEINVNKTEITGLKSLLEGLEKRKSKLNEEVENAEFILSEFDEKLNSSENDVEIASDIREKTMKELKSAQTDKEKLELKQRDLIRFREETDGRLHKSITKRDLLKGFEESYEGYGYAVKFIMNRRNRLNGIHGVTSDLIDVPEGYETAIQIALGGGMQNIICDDDRAASDCVNLLKREKAGRATFLPVKSIRGGKNISVGPDADKLKDENGFLGFASEIVKYDNQYNKIIEYLLGRTAIADTLESAIRLSKIYRSGIRFVTLDGDDINPSGAITGGRVKNSGPNVFERKNDIKTLEVEIKEYSENLERIKEDLFVAEDELRSAIINIKKSEVSLKEYDSNLLNFKANIDVLKNRKIAVQENLERWKTELKDISSEAEQTQKMIDSIQLRIDSNQIEIDKSEISMDDQLRIYNESKQKSDGIREEINKLKIELTSIESDRKYAEESVKRSRKESERLENELNNRINELSELRVSKEEALSIINDSSDRLKNLEKEYENFCIENETLSVRKKTADLRIKELEKHVKELDSKINKELAARHDYELKVAKGEMQIDSIKNRLWDSFEITFVEAQSMKKENFALSTAQRESRELKMRMKELEPVNIGAIEEYHQVSERYEFLNEQRVDLTEAIDSLNNIIKDMDKKINVRFMSSFEEIAVEFKKAFVELFGGGDAELVLDDADNILECTVEIVAQPPGKKLQNINLLSGGEKSLTAIALLCAILKVRPTPFCILDEVEAALDDLNIGRFVDYIREFNGVQFIVVTHQKVTMEKSDVMYGITMPEKGISKVVSLKMKKGGK